MQTLKIDLSTSRVDRRRVPASDLELDREVFQNITVSLECEKFDDGAMHVVLEASADVWMDCDRTLQRFTAPVVGSHEMVLYPCDQEPSMDFIDECIKLSSGQRFFDVSEAVRDTLMLAIPLRKVAPEAENQLIETVFGPPAPDMDERWDALSISMRGT